MVSTRTSDRSRKIVVQKATIAADEYNNDALAWVDHCTVSAGVSYGTGLERRQAAQETASIVATFSMLRNGKTKLIKAKDRILFDDGSWDITSVVPSKQFNLGYDITAIREIK